MIAHKNFARSASGDSSGFSLPYFIGLFDRAPFPARLVLSPELARVSPDFSWKYPQMSVPYPTIFSFPALIPRCQSRRTTTSFVLQLKS